MISTKAERNQEMMELLTAELKRDPDIDPIALLRKMYKEVNPPAAKTSNLPGHWVSVRDSCLVLRLPRLYFRYPMLQPISWLDTLMLA